MSKRILLLILALSVGIVYLEIVAVTGTWRFAPKPALKPAITTGADFVLPLPASIIAWSPLQEKKTGCNLWSGDKVTVTQVERDTGGKTWVTFTPRLTSRFSAASADTERCDEVAKITLLESDFLLLVEEKGGPAN